MEQEEIQSQSKSNKHSYGEYLLIFLFLNVVFSSLKITIGRILLSVFSASILAFFITAVQIVLDMGVWYFFVLWIADLIRRRGKIERPENKKVKLIINIIFAVMFLGAIISVLTASFE